MDFKPIVVCDNGPMDADVNLEPDFFTGFEPARRQEIVKEEAAFYRTLTEPFSVEAEINEERIQVTSFDGAPISVKHYWPKEVEEKRPALIFAHGGGWMTCSVETHNYVTAYIAAKAKIHVFSADYRLAPEHRFPTGLKDCYTVLQYVTSHAAQWNIDGGRLAVGGDSSGGNFAAALSLMNRDRGDSLIQKQILIYGVTDMTGSVQKKSAQVYAPVGDGGVASFQDIYLADRKDAWSPYVSPLLAEDLSHLPEALFINGECDPFRDDGLMYAQRLKESGGVVHVHVYKGMPHAFILRTYPKTFEALGVICDFLK